MKPISIPAAILAAVAFGACGFSTASLAAQSLPVVDTNPFLKLEQGLQSIDRRGQSKTGAVGYEAPLPAGELTNSREVVPAYRVPVQLAQSSDAAFRVNELEEQVRSLNGKVEEMTFQLLQLQEQIRKMQEDNEFRFRELEDQSALKNKNRNTAKAGENRLGKPKPSDAESSGSASDGNGTRKTIQDLLKGDAQIGDGSKLGTPPQNLGTLTFDENGNLVDSNVGKPIDLTGALNAGTAIPAGLPDTPEEMFDLGYQYVQGGDYEKAGEVFRQYVAEFPGSARDGEARFWLGESLFAQGDYEASARIFLENHKAHPEGTLAAQNLLKLGVSLSGLQQRELACATFAEVPKKYPGMSNAVRKRVAVEQQAAKCKNG